MKQGWLAKRKAKHEARRAMAAEQAEQSAAAAKERWEAEATVFMQQVRDAAPVCSRAQKAPVTWQQEATTTRSLYVPPKRYFDIVSFYTKGQPLPALPTATHVAPSPPAKQGSLEQGSIASSR